MPTISQFFGISIRIYRNDHPPAHFHVYYGEHAAAVSIETLDLLFGALPRRVFTMVLEWAMMHRPELRENWLRAKRHESALQIAPLDEEG